MQIRSRQLAFIQLLLTIWLACCTALPAQADPKARLVSNVSWSLSNPWFGGFSGAEVSADGARITLITDKGSLIEGNIVREGGALVTIQVISQKALKYASGTPLKGKRTDAEGLAIGQNGQAFVSFEHDHRVTRLDIKTGRTTKYTGAPEFAKFEPNSGLEALAVHPDGTLYALPEKAGGRKAPFPVYTLSNNQWRIAAHIPRRGPFLPVGADFDDAGVLYLLERAATPLGFRSRIRRFDPNAAKWGEVTLLTTGPGRFDNLEAISVWRDGAGQTILTLISDDNFLPIQRTQIIEFVVTQ
ncbi:MAG: esterase-like activity of phytase family protein [Sulfitobacter sp.]